MIHEVTLARDKYPSLIMSIAVHKLDDRKTYNPPSSVISDVSIRGPAVWNAGLVSIKSISDVLFRLYSN